jgi:peptidoglycan/LPS O-acetylase OafA/YrhL
MNGLRGYAAIGILLMHYLLNFDESVFQSLKNACPLLYGGVLPFLAELVFMFFIVSAFSMCCGYFERFRVSQVERDGKLVDACSFNTNNFYEKRYVRIWPFFALLVLIDVAMKPSWGEFYQAFADLTLAFNLLPNPDITVIGVGWFLGIVFLFYMIFPWFVFLLQNKKRAWLAMVVSVIFHITLVRYFLTDDFSSHSQIVSPKYNIIYCFPFFMGGGLLYLYKARIEKIFSGIYQKIILLVISITATCVAFSTDVPMPFGEKNFFVWFVFMLWVAYAITGGISFKGVKILDNRLASFLGGISMEVYLCHMVMFRAIEKVNLENYLHNPHILYWTWCVLGMGLSIAFSVFVTKVIFPCVVNKLKRK